MPAAAPLYDISTILHFADKPAPSPENAIVGLITHLTLAARFGASLALLTPLLSSRSVVGRRPRVRRGAVPRQLPDPGPTRVRMVPVGPNQTFELFAHAAYGLALVPFLLGFAGSDKRVPATSSSRATAARA